MSVKILVIGFQNSGTTVFGRILGFHPEVKVLLNEEFILKERHGEGLNTIPRENLSSRVGFDIDLCNWGEKLTILNASMPRTGGTIVDYAKIWKDYFSPDYKVLWVIRHPVDVILGNHVRRKVRGRIKNDSDRLELIIEAYKIAMPAAFSGYVNAKIDVGFVKFENILLNPVDSLTDIFDYLGLNSNYKCVYDIAMRNGGEKRRWFIQFDKAFNYSKNKVPDNIRELYPKIDYDINFLNDIAPGVKYGR